MVPTTKDVLGLTTRDATPTNRYRVQESRSGVGVGPPRPSRDHKVGRPVVIVVAVIVRPLLREVRDALLLSVRVLYTGRKVADDTGLVSVPVK